MNLTNASDKDFVLSLKEIILENLGNENFGVAELILATGVNRSNIYRRIKHITNRSVSQFIREVRLRKAMEMLQKKECTVAEISYKVGFGSPAYFNTCFHEYFGFPPGDIRKRSISEPEQEEGTVDAGQITDKQTIEKSLKHKRNKKVKFNGVLLRVVLLILLVPGIYMLINVVRNGNENNLSVNLFHSREKSIAVLPFITHSIVDNDRSFSDGILEDIINDLFHFKNLRVVSRTSVEQFRGTKKSIREVGKKLRVDYILEGSVQNVDKSVRVFATLIDVDKDQQVWSGKYDGGMDDMLSTQTYISDQITNELQPLLSSREDGKVARIRPANLEAYKLYLLGRYFLCTRTREGSERSIYYFEKSIRADPDNALAYSGLADVYFNQARWGLLPAGPGFAKAKEMAQFAIRLDASVAEAHATLGGILSWSEWKWNEAQKELQTAIQLNPNCATAHYYYSELLEVGNLKDEAREHLDYAIDLDPLFFWYYLDSSIFYYYDGNYEKSLEACRTAEEIHPGYEGIYRQYFQIYHKQGEYDKAASALQKFLLYQPDSTIIKCRKNVSEIYSQSGINGLLQYKIQLDSVCVKTLPLFLASAYNHVGKCELALECLEEAYRQHSNDIPWMNVNSDFDNLRNEPRYRELVKKLGLADFKP